MARKKSTAQKQAASGKAARKTAKRSVQIGIKSKPSTAASASKKPAAKKALAKRKTAAGKRKSKRLGRPRVPADARLDILFQRDYQAREIFAYLHVVTIRELEEHAPAEIIERITRPVVQTVDRIRKALAMNNRHLAGDLPFALAFLASLLK